jgi:hypothetical protein
MRIITKSKLPKWLIFILPFREEEYILKGIIVPIVMFFFIWTGTLLYELYESPFFGFVITISIIGVIIATMWWLLLQVDILHALRLRLKSHYQNTKDEDEKIRTQKRLSDLCVSLKRIKA